MNDDANLAASRKWVRVLRSGCCAVIAAVVSWKGVIYEQPPYSAAMPFVMCQMMATILGLIALMILLAKPETGPS